MTYGSNVLYEPLMVTEYQKSYLKYMQDYFNVTRDSLYIKYYNINSKDSTYNEELFTTHDKFTVADIQYDIYELTPLRSIQQIQNSSVDSVTTRGMTMDGATTIVTYTISNPKINDLVTFYEPLDKSNEIMRVMNIRTIVNALYNDIPVFELELDYAPIKEISKINFNKRYVYDMSSERYMMRKDYIEFIGKVKEVQEVLVELSTYYDKKRDIFQTDGKCLAVVNELISYLKKDFNNRYYRIFEVVKNPFNYFCMFNRQYLDLTDMPYNNIGNNEFLVFDIKTKEKETVIWEQEDQPTNNIENLLFLGKKLYQSLYGYNFK